ncbi:MAG: hypothetical protein IKV36_01065 [Clostridia bacterium]|nr:hypothetical protein [Clostridia bacterium]
MDVFFEQLVKVKFGTARKVIAVITVLIAAAAIAVVTAAAVTFNILPIVFLVDCGICYMAWWSVCQFRWEYEYVITNGDFDIDKIVNQRKRSRVLSFNCSEIQKIGKYNKDMPTPEGTEKIFCCSASEDCYYIIVRTSANKRVYLIIEPDERILEGIKKYLPRQMALEVFGSF